MESAHQRRNAPKSDFSDSSRASQASILVPSQVEEKALLARVTASLTIAIKRQSMHQGVVVELIGTRLVTSFVFFTLARAVISLSRSPNGTQMVQPMPSIPSDR
jgi:hypothetical protein